MNTTVLLVAAAPLHAATDVRDLFKALMLDDEKLPVLQSWSLEVEGTEQVAWEKPEIEWSEKAGAYTRTGRVVLLWSGAPSDGLDWEVRLLGGPPGYAGGVTGRGRVDRKCVTGPRPNRDTRGPGSKRG